MNTLIHKLQARLAEDFTGTALKVMIILWAIFIIFLAIVVENKWLLAGILAYEVLP